MTIELDGLDHTKLGRVLALLTAFASPVLALAEPAFAVPSTSETHDSETLVEIPDAALRKAVEEGLGKSPGDPITRGDMAALRGLYSYNSGVRQLVGIEHAINLVYLHLYTGTISNLAPLAGLASLRDLRLGGHAISDLSPLAGLTSLITLNLTRNEVSDVTPLAELTSLTVLILQNNSIADVSPLAGLASLTTLSIGQNEVSDVTPLAGLTSLVWLWLFGNSISDVTPLADMTMLTELSLSGNDISDVTPLAGMTALEKLRLHGNEIADVSPLAGMTTLTKLSLYDNEISDVTPLADMTSLTELDLSGNEIADVSPLASMSALTYLSLSRNEIADVTPLADMTALEDLWLHGNEIADVSPLADMSALTRLDLSRNAITDVTSLAGLTSLTTLDLAGWEGVQCYPCVAIGRRLNDIANITPLAGLTSLTELDLSGNRIADASPLADMTSLTELDLALNEITNLRPLAGMTSLTKLDLRGNRITDVSPLAAMTSLTDLVLNSNQITDLSPLAAMTSLTDLGLNSNRIWDVAPLASITSLTQLALSSNRIWDVSSLAGLTSLTSLYLSHNRISDLTPIVANDGLGDGDLVDLRRNELRPSSRSRETQIPALLQRGVDVLFDVLADLPDIPDDGLRDAAKWELFTGSGDLATLALLDASNHGIEDLSGVEGASNLRTLTLDRNRIADIGPVADLGDLRTLTLAHNMVEDWTPLSSLSKLRYLALDGNSLRELPLLPRSLAYLYLDANHLSDIATLANMWLYELQLSRNAISSLAPLAGMSSLQYLHVNDNAVTDISPLNFQSLRELHLRSNSVRDLSPLLDADELLMADVRRNPLADEALTVLDTLRERRVTVLAGETVPYFPAAGGSRQGFVRIVNRSDADGHVFVKAVDEAGVRAGPVRMDVEASQAVHFNSTDLEHGNARKGLGGGIGAPTAGDWRLEVISALDVEVLSYIRTEDGFVTAMHDVAADAMAPFFNPGSNENQRSILRVVNTEAEPAKWTTGGYDDRGQWHPMTGSLLVRPQHALTLTAQALENAHGLGDGHGKWRLRVRGFPWFAMSLLESPTGHLTNLSTAPDNATPLEDGATLHRLPLFPAAGGSRQGFVRVINRSYVSGEVAIEAVDDAGTRAGPVRLRLRPRRVAHFNSADLETGNAAKGLEGGVGIGEGDWRLEVTSELDLMVLSYARTADGFLTSLHDLAPVAQDGSHRVVFFNPGSNTRQVSKLRLMNDGERAATATITGIDDRGRDSGTVTLTVPAGSSLTFTSAELEAGADGLRGRLGDGGGKWRLRVRSDEPIAVMSLLETPSGHLTNVSTGTAD